MLSSGFVWNRWFRSIAFWAIVVGVVASLGYSLPYLDLSPIIAAFDQLRAGDASGLSDRSFAYALAGSLAALALGLAVAFLVLHAFMISIAIGSARRWVEKSANRSAFVTDYDLIYQKLERHPLIGHSWREFDETLVKRADHSTALRNTVRPQAFINFAVVREQLFGLKMMGSIPSYFVGTGLLLTFFGLVLALGEAGQAAGAADAGEMQNATRELLNVATFKFSTSIAGLGASIVLSLLFRIYTIWIEGAFNQFCHAVEKRLLYTAPQSVTFDMNEALHGQLTELKEINSAQFFARMGEQIAPHVQSAFATAFAPVTAGIDTAVNRLADSSQSGMSDMIDRFKAGMEGGAGAELRELAGALRATHDALVQAQQGMRGSGEDFGRRMSEAAENLNRLVSEAGAKLGEGSEISRTAMADIVTTLQSTFDRANQRVEADLGNAASHAADQIATQMSSLLGRLESQVEGFRAGISGFQEGMARHLDETGQRIAAAQAGAAESIGSISLAAAEALKSGLADALAKISDQMDRFTVAMRSGETALSSQAESARDVASQSRGVADAFRQTAEQVRGASAPLIQSGERIAGAADRMSASIAGSVAALEASQASSKELAEALVRHSEKLSGIWAGYAAQFDKVDEDLAKGVAALGEATQRQVQLLSDFAIKVDEGFAKAIDTLNPFLNGLQENTEDLGENVIRLREALQPTQQAAE
jgi:hypothetical protein